MKYETPELTALVPAINAICVTGGTKSSIQPVLDSPFQNDSDGAYQDWE